VNIEGPVLLLQVTLLFDQAPCSVSSSRPLFVT
jgi:hypothetical protein